MKIKNIVSTFLLAGTCLFYSCDDFLSTNPSVDLSDEIVLADEAGLLMLLNGTYRIMKDGYDDLHATSPIGMKSYSTAVGSIDIASYPGAGSEVYGAYQFNAGTYISDGTLPQRFWKNYYEIINNTNLLIANSGNALNSGDHIKGQALVLRARCYYQLVRLYQHTYIIAKDKPGVPLYTEPNDASSEPKARSTVAEVYTQIVKDLEDAIILLSDFSRGNDFTVYDQDVAYFILADVYLTMNEWAKARDAASVITAKYNLMSEEEFKSGFAVKNNEWILGYQQTGQDSWYYNSIGCVWYWETGSQWNARMFYPTTDFVENILTSADVRYLARKLETYDWYISDKFNDRYLGGLPVLSDMCDYRAAEMYLVEAECRARLNDPQALTILNDLQIARNGTLTQPNEDLLEAILLERRKELYGEGVDLWDVKRLQKGIKRVEDQINGGHYYSVDIPANSNKLVLQIPKYEMTNNPNMTQNPDPESQPVFVP